MLSEKEREDIIAELRGYPHKPAACIRALQIVQQYRGWVSDEMPDIAELLGMTLDEVHGVASFYSRIYRKPVGKHVILVCDSVSCWVMGYERVLRRLSAILGISMGETSADGQFTLLPTACLGACDRAPAMMIDTELYTDLTPERVDEILGRYR